MLLFCFTDTPSAFRERKLLAFTGEATRQQERREGVPSERQEHKLEATDLLMEEGIMDNARVMGAANQAKKEAGDHLKKDGATLQRTEERATELHNSISVPAIEIAHESDVQQESGAPNAEH